MATFRSKFRISRKDKKILKKEQRESLGMTIENARQAAFFFSDKNSHKVYEIAKQMFNKIDSLEIK